MSSSIEVMVSSEGGGQGDGQLQEGDGGLKGNQAGGEGVPEIMVSGQDQCQKEKFETIGMP